MGCKDLSHTNHFEYSAGDKTFSCFIKPAGKNLLRSADFAFISPDFIYSGELVFFMPDFEYSDDPGFFTPDFEYSDALIFFTPDFICLDLGLSLDIGLNLDFIAINSNR
jgi:hypothetical protein